MSKSIPASVAAVVGKAQAAVNLLNSTEIKKVWKISGTAIYGATKEELKANRRKLNTEAGINEVETKKGDQIIPADPSNKWPFRIAKGPDHPHNAPRFDQAPIGATFRCRGFNVDLEKISATQVVNVDSGSVGTVAPEIIVDLV